MKPLVIQSKQLFEVASKKTIDIFGKPILQSLNKQRRNKVLCDVSIHCGNEQIVAHRCVLYAVSEYCRTLFTGSLPPIYKDGMLKMELSLFSAHSVKVFIELIYGQINSKITMVDVSELMRLSDYLQVSADILTEIFRHLISTENCLRLYELSLLCFSHPLQRILESFICSNLPELVENFALELSDFALSTLSNNPLYFTQPVELIGVAAKEKSRNFDVGYRLITYDMAINAEAENKTWSAINDVEVEMTVYKETKSHIDGSYIFYFYFHQELHAITSRPNFYEIYKYHQHKKGFSRMFFICEDHENTPEFVKLPTILPPELRVSMVVTSMSEDYIFILFEYEGPGLWLMKLKFNKTCKPAINLEKFFVGLDNCDKLFCKRSLYFMTLSVYCKYNIDSRSSTRHELKLQDLADQDHSSSCSYCEFKNVIYLFIVSEDVVKDEYKVKIYSLDEEHSLWVFCSDHVIKSKLSEWQVISSPSEIYLILHVDEDFKDVDDAIDRIYHYDPRSKTLCLSKEVNLSGDEHLFVPDYLVI